MVTVMTRCDYLRWAQASALSGMETFFPPAQANLERALLAIMIRWYCLEGGGGCMHQRYQGWKPSSSQPRLVGKLEFVIVMMCAALPQRSQRWKAYFPQPRLTGSELVCL